MRWCEIRERYVAVGEGMDIGILGYLSSKFSFTLLRINGKIETDSSLIEGKVISFFNALFNGHHNVDLVETGTPFAPNNSCLDEFLEGLGALSDVDSEKLHEDISEQEIGEVIKECDNNKAPGCDGLSYEFYKAVWPVIKVEFVQILQCQLERLRLIDSDTLAATRLASKVEGIPAIDELRPISLLNCDYKILTKMLVKRLIPFLKVVIKSGQLCTVEKKNILFGVSNVLPSILYT